MLIVPFMVNGIAPNSTPGEWTWIFLITASVLCITNILFALMCSAKPAYWTTDGFSTANSSVHVNNQSISSVSSITKQPVSQTPTS
jgi:hypothetical protein